MKTSLNLIMVITVLLTILISCESDEKIAGTTSIPPSCKILTPSDNQLFYKDTTITIEVKAEDEDGFISKVELYLDSLKVGKNKEVPFSFNLSLGSFPIGIHTLKAVSYDDENLSAVDSSSFEILDNEEPFCKITNLENFNSFFSDTTITINATATDKDGYISKVEFYFDSIKLHDDFEYPYSITIMLDTMTVDTHSVKIVAIDNDSLLATDSCYLEIKDKPSLTPKVVINAPAQDFEYMQGSILTIQANCLDSDSKALENKLYINNELIFTNNIDYIFYEIQTKNLPLGTNKVKIVSRDAEGINISDSVSVTVTETLNSTFIKKIDYSLSKNTPDYYPRVLSIEQGYDGSIFLAGQVVVVTGSEQGRKYSARLTVKGEEVWVNAGLYEVSEHEYPDWNEFVLQKFNSNIIIGGFIREWSSCYACFKEVKIDNIGISSRYTSLYESFKSGENTQRNSLLLGGNAIYSFDQKLNEQWILYRVADKICRTKENQFIVGSLTGSYANNNIKAAILKVDENKNILWEKGFPEGRIKDLALDGNENIIFTIGTTLYKLSCNGESVWSKKLTNVASCLTTNENNEIFISGAIRNSAWISKLDTNGSDIWHNSFILDTENDITCTVTDIENAYDNGFIIGGYSSNESDFFPGLFGFIIKTDTNGEVY